MRSKFHLSYQSRKRWSLFILVVGLPIYIVLTVNFLALFERPSILVELLIYVGLGIVWALPFKFIFRGVGVKETDSE